MRNWWLLFAGVAGGILAGMGMGGGTLTIPLLTLLLDVNQTTAQFVNLLAFIPTGIIALCVHLKNKLVVFKDMGYILVPSIIGTILSASFVFKTNSDILSYLFGGFLVIIALISLGVEVFKKS